MADIALRNKWLLDAAEDGRSTVAQQTTFLQAKRRIYSDAISSGDWAVQNQTGAGRSSSAVRGVSDQANHDAIVGALRYLGATDLGTGAKIYTATYSGIQS